MLLHYYDTNFSCNLHVRYDWIRMGDDEPVTLDQYIALNPQQRKSVRKPALQSILDDLVTNDSDRVSGPIIQKLDRILDELKEIKETSKENDDEIKRLKTVVNDQSKIIEGQQRFLESLDADRRCRDLIVLGLNETATSDNDQLTDILRAIDLRPEDIDVSNMERLGRVDDDEGNSTTRKRPLKVTLESRAVRNTILKNAYKLKDQAEQNIAGLSV